MNEALMQCGMKGKQAILLTFSSQQQLMLQGKQLNATSFIK